MNTVIHYEWTDKWRHFKPSLFLFFLAYIALKLQLQILWYACCHHFSPRCFFLVSLILNLCYEGLKHEVRMWVEESRMYMLRYGIFFFFHISSQKMDCQWKNIDFFLQSKAASEKFPQSKERFLSSSSGSNPVPLKSCLCMILFKPHTTAGDFTD